MTKISLKRQFYRKYLQPKSKAQIIINIIAPKQPDGIHLTKLTNFLTKIALCPVDDINTKKPQYLYNWYCGFYDSLHLSFKQYF